MSLNKRRLHTDSYKILTTGVGVRTNPIKLRSMAGLLDDLPNVSGNLLRLNHGGKFMFPVSKYLTFSLNTADESCHRHQGDTYRNIFTSNSDSYLVCTSIAIIIIVCISDFDVNSPIQLLSILAI